MEWKLIYNGYILIGIWLIIFLVCILVTIFNFNYVSLVYSITFGFIGIYMLFGEIINFCKNKKK